MYTYVYIYKFSTVVILVSINRCLKYLFILIYKQWSYGFLAAILTAQGLYYCRYMELPSTQYLSTLM